MRLSSQLFATLAQRTLCAAGIRSLPADLVLLLEEVLLRDPAQALPVVLSDRLRYPCLLKLGSQCPFGVYRLCIYGESVTQGYLEGGAYMATIRGGQGEFIDAMECLSVTKVPEGNNWIHEPPNRLGNVYLLVSIDSHTFRLSARV